MISDLQKEILSLTLEKGFLSTRDILCAVWGWEPGPWGTKRTTIGEAAYKSGHSSLSRCITRLWRKHLIVIWKPITNSPNSRTAISLTPEGKTIAMAILAEAENDG